MRSPVRCIIRWSQRNYLKLITITDIISFNSPVKKWNLIKFTFYFFLIITVLSLLNFREYKLMFMHILLEIIVCYWLILQPSKSHRFIFNISGNYRYNNKIPFDAMLFNIKNAIVEKVAVFIQCSICQVAVTSLIFSAIKVWLQNLEKLGGERGIIIMQ